MLESRQHKLATLANKMGLIDSNALEFYTICTPTQARIDTLENMIESHLGMSQPESQPEPTESTPLEWWKLDSDQLSSAEKLERDQQFNRESLAFARMITPESIDSGIAPTCDHTEILSAMLGYSESGLPVFEPDLIESQKADLLYSIYAFGKGTITQKAINDSRVHAAAILAADDLASEKLSAVDRVMLSQLSDSNDDTVARTIDTIRDKRRNGTLTRVGPVQKKSPDSYVSAAADDNTARLRESSLSYAALRVS